MYAFLEQDVATGSQEALLLGIAENPLVGAVGFMPILAITRIGKYYRTTVPREVRKPLDIKESDIIGWIFEDGKIVIRKAPGGKS